MLIAEDDPNDVFLLKRALAKSGLPVNARFCRDGEDALDYLLGKPPYDDRKAHPLPRVVLLDIKMPRRDGFDLLREIRSNVSLKRMTAIVFTTSSLQRDIDHAYDLGANAFLVKTADTQELSTTLRRLYEFWFVVNRPCSGCGSGLLAA